MEVHQLMDPQVAVCRIEDTLDDAIRRMIDSGSAILPVVNRAGSFLGTISERDICSALYLENARPTCVPVSEAMDSRRVSCGPDDPAECALRVMRKFRVRWLPVTDTNGQVVGMVAGNDLELAMRREAEAPADDDWISERMPHRTAPASPARV